jgi:hypothetical protein
MIINRYDDAREITTSLNPFEDLRNWIGYLSSLEYIIDLLVKKHNYLVSDARIRAKAIIPHVNLALEFINQAFEGPAVISFLPIYYALLNLSKIYILFGPYYQQLSRHRWHGITYTVDKKDSRSLLTEIITIRKGGTFPLFYRTLVNKIITHDHSIKMGDVYPYIWEVSEEYLLATNLQPRLALLKLDVESKNSTHQLLAQVLPYDDKQVVTINNIPALRNMRKVKGTDNTFISPEYNCPIKDREVNGLKYINRVNLFYYNDKTYLLTSISSRTFPIAEEIPIVLLYFHMSSIIRYKPEFVLRIQKSRCWPFIMSARRQALYKYLLLFWCHANNQQLIVQSE